VEVITVAATVRDKDNRLVKGLPRDVFEVYDDGQRQAVTQFTSERVPVSLGVLVDVSDSMFGQRIVDARAAVDRFLLELLNPSDEFFVLAFNHAPRILTGWTNSPARVRQALDELRRRAARPNTTRSSPRCRSSPCGRSRGRRSCSSPTAPTPPATRSCECAGDAAERGLCLRDCNRPRSGWRSTPG
jgi:VWFA-related protein